jgi:hypothetical protein
VHIDHALDYNQDPSYLADILIHKLTVEARRRTEQSGSSRRELARRLGTSNPQLYRLLDPTNTRKSLGQLVALLHLLDCEVEFVIKPRHAAQQAAAADRPRRRLSARSLARRHLEE